MRRSRPLRIALKRHVFAPSPVTLWDTSAEVAATLAPVLRKLESRDFGRWASTSEQLRAFALTYRLLASCYAHMGRLDDAREIVTRLRAITSVVIPDLSHLRNAEHRELFVSGLRLAAGEAA